MTREDFIDWKSNPVTKAFLSAIREQIIGLKDELAYQALDADPRMLSAKAGAIQALEDVLDYRLEESE